ncbi:MaoC family dehydratase [Microbulbifer hydrolyticus]|uniref:Acyl dehydratase n=1 Tax=Microbulbifer hydrolyticus TaxID=48074 RepID=A0A6P1TB86_9GAMM|nr:MaoC/PaaZ C-terminal domain-containing protein [Microbulbifer hydrolyticus]MBB5213193.1 acyl dehydratase [Microbulbifer hydrolyticus]QHQ38539.1 acyl dehydratase [Microbulbifer hydrolyticus]
MPLQIQLSARPSVLPLYFRALTARKPGQLTGGSEAVLATVSLQKQRLDTGHLRDYRAVCGFESGASVPATYPFVLAMPLQLNLLVSEAFPFPVLGVVHVRNRIRQFRRLAEHELLDIQCELMAPVAVKRGYEFDLVTRVHVAGELVWECMSTLLSRSKQQRKPDEVANRRRRNLEAVEVAEGHSLKWHLPADTGRRYARVSGDRNPIHLFASTAKLFGFPRAIAHGMWLKAHCLASLEAAVADTSLWDSVDFSVEFKKPVLLPSSVTLQYMRVESGLRFSLVDAHGKRAHLCGRIEQI